MFDQNTKEGKQRRIETITRLISKLNDVPGNVLSYDEVHSIQMYLSECKKDLQKQIER